MAKAPRAHGRLVEDLHTLVLNGVYREKSTSLVWYATAHLQTRQVGEGLEHAVLRMARYLRRRGLLDASDEEQSDDDAEGRLERRSRRGACRRAMSAEGRCLDRR